MVSNEATTQSPNGRHLEPWEPSMELTAVRTAVRRQSDPPTWREAPLSIPTTLSHLRTPGLALFAGLVICTPVHADRAGHFGAAGHSADFGFHGGAVRGFTGFHAGFRRAEGWWGWPAYSLFLAAVPFYCLTFWC